MSIFGSLEELRNKPIPGLSQVVEAKKAYRQWPIDLDVRNGESCVDALHSNLAGSNHYYREDNAPYYERIAGAIESLYLRAGVVRMLQSVNKRLGPAGLEVFIHDAWRPAAVQYQMRNVWFADKVRKRHPSWSPEQVEEEVNTYWALAVPTESEIDPLSPPPHSTGGAVDLTLRWKSGELLWMGTIFDDMSLRAHTGALEVPDEELSFTEEEARKNRRLLYWLMADEGFANNPTEWWHFSYGDQMWAKLTSALHGKEVPAFYSVIGPRT